MTIEEIKAKWPQYFKDCFEFSIGNGWLPLIETICEFVESNEQRVRDNIEFGRKHTSGVYVDNLPIYEAQLKHLEKNPFSFSQIKEKFGVLRAHYNGGIDAVFTCIIFAESLSVRICEDCGCLAEIRTKGYIRTLCLKCAEIIKEQNPQSNWTWETI